jgi:alpha-tubulin suppressor-like RCC1 family protein
MHALARTVNGEVWAWGFDEKGQLGTNATALFSGPVRALIDGVNPITGATDVYAFGNQSFARIGGKTFGWGDNSFGQLGQPVSTKTVGFILLPVEFKP